MTDTGIHPFRIDVPEPLLADLRSRLRSTRLPHPLPGDDWSTGVPVSVLAELTARWAEHDWRATEDRLNRTAQFTTRIGGQTLHFVHVRSEVPGATPLPLLHGWPGSFLEFEHLVGPLTDPAAHGGRPEDAFDVVIPSLPGFGFSTPLETSGWTTARVAGALAELMTRIGYDRFLVQGGDVGAAIAPELGRVASDRVLGVHVNGTLGDFVASVDEETAELLSPLDHDRLRRVAEFMQREFGYIAIQSTRPGLVGAMLADSPVGQLAWMVDKLQAWSHPTDADATAVLGDEFVFANASLYWFTASAGSAAYVGYAQKTGWGQPLANSGVPTAAIQFAHDIGVRHIAEASNTIVRWTDVEDRGGHFAALEEPDLLVGDIRAFAAQIRTCVTV